MESNEKMCPLITGFHCGQSLITPVCCTRRGHASFVPALVVMEAGVSEDGCLLFLLPSVIYFARLSDWLP